MITEKEKREFKSAPEQFLTREIIAYVVKSPLNHFKGLDEPIWDEPLVGFADGDEAIFKEYKGIIGDFHMTPREALATHLKIAECGYEKELDKVSVIAWVLPSTEKTRRSMRGELMVPSLRWDYTRWYGQDFNFRLSRYISSLLETLGFHAVAPELSPAFERKTLADGPASNWSQRHVAYAAGLGTFSLNDALITPKGIAVRLGSVVTSLALKPSPRPYVSFRANCLFYRDGSCGRCVARCPAGAITETGHDRKKCREFLYGRQRELVIETGRQGYVGPYFGCGLCQTGVPCESGIPALGSDKK
ncbi:MAG: 4Fe-4S double cluster binding domain-containing protein [Chloroflexota bacterium]